MPHRAHLVLFASAILALVLGTWGFAIQTSVAQPPLDPPLQPGLLDAVYRALQLFVLEGGHVSTSSWQLQVARFLAPATALGSLSLLLDRLQQQIRLRFARNRQHYIVCGLGRKGVATALSLRNRGKVVAIERHGDHPGVDTVEAAGIPVVRGDARHAAILHEAGIAKAKAIVIACGSDDEDVRVTRQAAACIQEADGKARRSYSKSSVQLIPHLDDVETRQLVRAHIANVQKTLRGVTLRLVDYCHQDRAARALFVRHPLDHTRIGPDSHNYPHLVLVGFGRMGEAVFRQALQIAHYPNGKKLKVDIFDRNMDNLWNNFCGRFPNFASTTLPCPADVQCHHGDIVTTQAMAKLETVAQNGHAHVTIVIALDSETESAMVVSHLPRTVAEKQIPVCVRIEQPGGLAELMRAPESTDNPAGPAQPKSPLVRLFGHVEATAQIAAADTLPDDTFAKAMHEYYLYNFGTKPPIKPSHMPWDDLSEELRDSNRRAADFAPILLRSLGFAVIPKGKQPEGLATMQKLPASLMESACKAEHSRWYAERFLGGWQLAKPLEPGEDRKQRDAQDAARRTNRCMVAWDAVPNDERRKDEFQVNNYIAFYEQLGFAVVPD